MADNTFDEVQKEYWTKNTNLRPYDHPVVKLFARQRVNFIKKIMNGWQPINALDVGCGDGFGMTNMDNLVQLIHGCDISPAMLAANPAKDELLSCANAYYLPYENSNFDLVYCWELLHHIENPLAVVKEMTRVSKECVILCEPNSLNPAMYIFGLTSKVERGLLKFTPNYTKKLLKMAGLKKIKQYHVSLFTPNRTPYPVAKLLSKFPYQIPWYGLYSINIGYKN
jgi:ubiquinone/menaquinone biosynthesis C-methylase UbiE